MSEPDDQSDAPAAGSGGTVTADLAGDLSGAFVRHLGLVFKELTGDRVVATWQAVPKLHQPYGIVHGGVHCSVFETLASVGGAAWYGERGQVVGVNNSTDFLRAVREGALTSTAVPVHQGRLQQLWRVETVTDDDAKVIAIGQVRLQNIEAGRL